jgi:hypothetical protein
VFLDGERGPDNYEVRHYGRTVGRIVRLRSTGRELWRWTQSGGVADSLNERRGTPKRASGLP